jgi:uncharacterized membrane protein YccC
MMSLRERITYCLANVAAVLSALYIAFWLDLDRPYWAMFTVFIVSKPLSGAVRAKGIFRLAGTLVGASMSVFLVPPLVQSPVLLSLAASIWIGLCLFFALQDRTPRSYSFLLAGYSVGIIGLSAVYSPTSIFDIAVSRVEEITIGIICASIAHSVFFPRNLGHVLRDEAEKAIRLTAQVAQRSVAPNPHPPSTAEIATLTTALTDLGTVYSQIGYETSNVSRKRWVMMALLDRLAGAMSRASLICGSLQALSNYGHVSERVRSKLDEVSAALAWLAAGQNPILHSIAAQEAAAAESDDNTSGEKSALEALVMSHAARLAVSLVESHEFASALAAPGSPIEEAKKDSGGPRALFYRDQALAILSGASACVATLIACVIWIETSWPEGFVAAQFAAIGCSLFATLDTPTKPIFAAIVGILVALPIAAVYEFAILPGLDGFPSLALVLTPLLLLFSYLQTFERLEGAAMVLAIAFAGALAFQESFASDFASFANSNLAEIIGLLIAAATLLVFRTIDPVWNARRLLNSGWAIVRNLACSHRDVPTAWLLPMFDRTGQAAIRLVGLGPDAGRADVLLGLRVGLNLVDLRRCEAILGSPARTHIDDALHQCCNLAVPGAGTAFERQCLSKVLEHLFSMLGHLPPSRERTEGLAAAIGLRLDLDPRYGGGEAAP